MNPEPTLRESEFETEPAKFGRNIEVFNLTINGAFN
jgi:hypothetical protein